MQRHSMDEGVFIRSLATRGHFGGLTQSTRAAIDVLDAMGKDYVLVETVGVGQDEVDVMKTSHTTVIVVIPGMGDDIQAIKAGILEVGDIFVVNKADRDGADKTRSDLELMLNMNREKYAGNQWRPPILKLEAAFDKGVSELLSEIENHRNHLLTSDGEGYGGKRREQVRDGLVEMVRNRLVQRVLHDLLESGAFEKAVDAIMAGEVDPYTACDELVIPVTGPEEAREG
jgi:LAO/AO transport system kinase